MSRWADGKQMVRRNCAKRYENKRTDYEKRGPIGKGSRIRPEILAFRSSALSAVFLRFDCVSHLRRSAGCVQSQAFGSAFPYILSPSGKQNVSLTELVGVFKLHKTIPREDSSYQGKMFFCSSVCRSFGLITCLVPCVWHGQM